MTKKVEPETAALEELAEQLREAAQRGGLSRNQVAKLSGVSRKHVGVAFDGGNISVAVLIKLLRVPNLRAVKLGDITMQADGNAIDPQVLDHARTLVESVERLAHDAHDLLRNRERAEPRRPRARR